MIGQIPLIIVSKKVEAKYGGGAGNVVMWSSLILGHPLAIMMYYHDYIIDNYGASLVSQYANLQSATLWYDKCFSFNIFMKWHLNLLLLLNIC